MLAPDTPEGWLDHALHGILVTHRRPHALRAALEALRRQSRRLDRLVVVDNAPALQTEGLVRHSDAASHLVYIASGENVGPAGGIARAMEMVLSDAGDGAWVAMFDDDDPPHSDDVLRCLIEFGIERLRRDPLTAGVGLAGARFDPTRGRILRIRDDELEGPVVVHYIGGGQVPIYRVAVIREVGTFNEELFFGFEELDFGWRLVRAGYHLYVDGERWRHERERRGRVGVSGGPSLRLADEPWRRYYSIRNLIHVLRTDARNLAAARVATRATGKAVINLGLRPRTAAQHLPITMRACWDGWTARMGRRVEPEVDETGHEALIARS
jgi:glycosyltransferase involved in cell wall biosynthesis